MHSTYTFATDTPRGVTISQELDDTPALNPSLRHLKIAFIEWKDDAVPSKSNKASKTGSIWIWTMTIFEAGVMNDSSRATFPLAIGPKSESHDFIEKVIGADMKKLSTTRQYGFIGARHNRDTERITFSAKMYVSLGDQPERRGGNYLMGGNSRAHCRWRYACDVKQLVDLLPSCKSCIQKMKEIDSQKGTMGNFSTLHNCTNCTNWMFGDLSHPLLAYKPPKSFPKGFNLGGQESLVEDIIAVKPIELTYEKLIAVVTITHRHLENSEWTPATASTYLIQNAICKSYADAIVKRGVACAKIKLAYENSNNDQDAWETIQRQVKRNPEKYKMAPIPSIWLRDISLHLLVDTPMHLLFLGIAKSIFWFIGEWSTKSGRGPAFRSIAMKLLKDLENLKLGWLTFNIGTFDSWGGWISEKYQSLCRVALWVYGPLLTVDDVPAFVPPTDRTIANWLVKDYRKWMKVRGLPTCGTKEELKEKVLFYTGLPLEQQPQVLPPDYGKAESVMNMLKALVIMLTTILQPTISGELHMLMYLHFESECS